jgi:dihydroxyacetone kinase-like protein
MVDAMDPAVVALEAHAGDDPATALAAAAQAAATGRDATIPLVARKGRASYLGERSAGHQDPGATSTTILFESLRDALTTRQ